MNLTSSTVMSICKAPEGSQPMITADEMMECEAAVIACDEFKALLKKYYGVEDTSLVMVDIWYELFAENK